MIRPSKKLSQLIVGGLFALSLISFGGFLLSINREYFGTYFDTRTGSQFLCDTWRDGKADKERFYVFSKHQSYICITRVSIKSRRSG